MYFVNIKHLTYAQLVNAAIVFMAAFLFSPKVLAWGPVAHLDFALQLLSSAQAVAGSAAAGLALVAPSILKLINRHKMDFLYGTLAADVIVGKNRAKTHDHCHNWAVAQKLLKEAVEQSESRSVFMLGYIHHLGADVVAHNYIIPQMLVIHYKTSAVGHLYWEIRADQRLLKRQPEINNIWTELSQIDFGDHDKFLEQRLVSTIFSNKLSRGIYKHNLNMQRKAPWRGTVARLDKKSKLLFHQKDLLIWRNMAINYGAVAVNIFAAKNFASIFEDETANSQWALVGTLDPTGKDAIEQANYARKMLKREFRKNGNSDSLKDLYTELLNSLPNQTTGSNFI